MQCDLDGRIGVVTGASAGIGEAVARELVSRGARVVLNARRVERLENLKSEMESEHGAGCCAIESGDCAEQSVVGAMLDAAESTLGGPADLVVVNAGRGLAGSVVTSDPGEWGELVRTNLLGVAALLRVAAERMISDFDPETWTGKPRDIIVLGSIVGRHVSPFSSMYGSTKSAVHSLAEALRREIGPKGVRVTLIEPAVVTSEFQSVAGYTDDLVRGFDEKFGPVLEPADVARAIGFVASQPAHV
ncbi:MAG: SDR family NAD(P)-dependent oxidoreductase, partial [Phycisphaerales bacterium]|nr:SDR family NAD(P)-dependent oxidoreductase [Phycisphaerales bacterium]